MVYSNRGAAVERNKNVLLAFSNGLTESVRLTNDDDLSTFDFDAHVTTFVRITVDTVYTTYNNGAGEIEFYGDVCLRDDASWCTHDGSTYEFRDCDGDGMNDHVCSDTEGHFGVMQSSNLCLDTWPDGQCTYDEKCSQITIGPGPVLGEMFPVPPRQICPTVVNRENWLGSYTYGDTFAVTQDGDMISVVRTDNGNPAEGWGMNLQFECCSGEGIIWRPLFRQTHPFVQPTADWTSYKPTETSAPNFSALDTLESCRDPQGKLTLKIVWPSRVAPNYNDWKQASNPMTTPAVTGYEPVDIHFADNFWGGLAHQSGGEALLDGFVNNIHYTKVTSGTCNSNGFEPITTLNECTAAAAEIGISNMSAATTTERLKPEGCHDNGNLWLATHASNIGNGANGSHFPICRALNHSHQFYAIGSSREWDGGIPGAARAESVVELYCLQVDVHTIVMAQLAQEFINIALGKHASQSSTTLPAEQAVDGSTSVGLETWKAGKMYYPYVQDCSWTGGRGNPDWWRVDLGGTFVVGEVHIYHRSGSTHVGLSPAQMVGTVVKLSDTADYRSGINCHIMTGRQPNPEVGSCDGFGGRFITVVRQDDAMDGNLGGTIQLCELQANGLVDTDGDHTADLVDSDDDGDGVADYADLRPLDPAQGAVAAVADVDTDGDLIGDLTDPDDDDDGAVDGADLFPLDPSETGDSDGDEVGDGADALPLDPTETLDTDGDTMGDNADGDDDDDGMADGVDAFPLDPTSWTTCASESPCHIGELCVPTQGSSGKCVECTPGACGCMDPLSPNFDPSVVHADGSCAYEELCTDAAWTCWRGQVVADASCLCLTWPWAGSDQFYNATTDSLTLTVGGVDYPYVTGYGMAACSPHDALLPPSCADADGAALDGAPSWCYSSWCYVDPDNCALPNDPSSYFHRAGEAPLLFYSYETCSSENTFQGSEYDELASPSAGRRTQDAGRMTADNGAQSTRRVFHQGSKQLIRQMTFADIGATEPGPEHSVGGAIFTDTSTSVIASYATFIGNLVTEGGGAIFLGAYSHLSTSHTVFSGNSAKKDGTYGKGGAIWLSHDSVMSATHTTFHANSVGAPSSECVGGAIFGSDRVTISTLYTAFVGNFADCSSNSRGGAMALWPEAVIDAAYTTFSGNYNSQQKGGAIYVWNAHATLWFCTFMRNEIRHHGGLVLQSQHISDARGTLGTPPTEPGRASIDALSTTFEPLFEAGEEYATAVGSLTVSSGLGCERQNPCPVGMICSYYKHSRWCTPCPEREAGLDGLVCEMCPSGQGPSDGRFDFPVAPSNAALTRCGGDGRCGGCVKCAGSVEACVGDADNEGRVCKLKTDRSACEAGVGANCTYTASTLDFSASGECLLCAFPRFVSADRKTCEACAAGQMPNLNRTSCMACTGNTISPFGYHCEACPATAVPTPERAACLACPTNQLARLNMTEESAVAGGSTRRMLRRGSSSGPGSGTASGAVDGGGDDVVAAGATSSAVNVTKNACTCADGYFNTSRGVKCHSGNYARSRYAFECTECDELECVTSCNGEVLNVTAGWTMSRRVDGTISIFACKFPGACPGGEMMNDDSVCAVGYTGVSDDY
jgi:hypothetical protein